MDFNPVYAIIAGLSGIILMTVVGALGEVMGVKIDVPMLLGTLFKPKGPAAWDRGLVLHLALGIAAFLVYAVLFDLLDMTHRVEFWGPVFGFAHGIVAGLAMGFLPKINRRVAETPAPATSQLQAPGPFAIGSGRGGPAIVLAAHVVYGAVATTVYAIPYPAA